MSDSNRTQMYYVKETVYGETPASALTEMRFTSESLSYGIQSKSSDELRADRQTTDLVLVGASAGGGVNIELSYGAFDAFFVAALMSADWSTAVNVSGATDIAAVTTGNWYTSGATDFTTKHIVPGQWVLVSGFSTAANNGYKLVTAVGAAKLTVAVGVAALVDESATPAITMKGTMIRNGTAETSFTLERKHADVTQFFQYTGMMVDKMSLSLKAGDFLTGSFDFKGAIETLDQTTCGTGTANAASTGTVMNAVNNVASILEGSTLATVTGAFFQSLDFSLSNNLRDLTAIGTLGAVDVGLGRCDVTGNVNAYFVDETLYDKYIGNTATGLSFRVVDTAGNAYIFTFHSVKYSSAKANAGGSNQDVMVNLGWTAIRNATYNCMIQIDKFSVT